jgi:NAD(P)H dehydrogenase (quinone)
MTTYLITGATGALGRLAVDSLLRRVPASSIIAGVRDTAKAADLAAKGVTLRELDYNRPETIGPALKGVDRVLLISGNEVGKRTAQHTAVIQAARAAGVSRLAYTSILRADTSTVGLAKEHKATEEALAKSGVPYVLLRHGWYTENFLNGIAQALQFGALAHCAGDGRFSSATRAEFADADIAVLTADTVANGQKYELAGSSSFTKPELATILSRLSGKAVANNALAEAAYNAMLVQAGLPGFVADILASSDAGAARGDLFDDSHTLEKLIGRPTQTIEAAVNAALAAQK